MKRDRWLIAIARRLTPAEDRVWLDALLAEQLSASPGERGAWLRGAASIVLASLRRQALNEPLRWPLAAALGLLFAYTTPERGYVPELAAYQGAVAAIAFLRPGWSWRWAVVAGLFLHLAGAAGFGPYHTHALDAPLPLMPGFFAALIACWLRGRYDWFRQRRLRSRTG
jgi:hypothetical protein